MWFVFLNYIHRYEVKTHITNGVFLTLTKGDKQYVLLFATNSIAQSIGQTIRGTVVDAFTGSPIIGATIVVMETNPIVGCSTDDKGEFTIKDIQPGRWTFTSTFVG